MEASTSIRTMLTNEISVPNYQRAYSWETELHVKTFLQDLDNHIKSGTASNYYFGHFLFEEPEKNKFFVIDGQQRATTIIVCVSALFGSLNNKKYKLSTEEETLYEDLIVRKGKIKFSTVNYDNQDFVDYIIKKDKAISEDLKLNTNSAKRFTRAYCYFMEAFKKRDSSQLIAILNCIADAGCTTHVVKVPSEAIQMFIFQNDRGKTPTNLEVLKSKFMFQIHLRAKDDLHSHINTISERFEKIYRDIAQIDDKMDEDEILRQAYRVYDNSLHARFSTEKIDSKLEGGECLNFIDKFGLELETAFDAMRKFHSEEKTNFSAHSLLVLKYLSIAYPFIIKAYNYAIPENDKEALFNALEQIVFRHRIIGTRAELDSRLNEVYQGWTKEKNAVQEIINKIDYLKNSSAENWWWAYWHKNELQKSINGWIEPPLACYILWKYENHLSSLNKGYKPLRFDQIIQPQCEHIAPQTPPPGEKVATGYCRYTDSFKNEFLNCLGNYLLISKSHNCAIGNQPFADKCATYIKLIQQREVKEIFDKGQKIWNKELIAERHNKIKAFVLNTL